MSENFNPKEHVVTIKTKDGPKPYLSAVAAIVWFRTEHPAPKSRIITVPDLENSLVRAEIYLDGELVSTGHSKGDGKKSLEKLETGAVRRALANLGYGTISALASEYDGGSSLSPESEARVALASAQMTVEDAKAAMAPGGGKRRVGKQKSDSKADVRFIEVETIERAKDKRGKLYLNINEGKCQGFGQRDALVKSGWIDDNELVTEGQRVMFEPLAFPVIQAMKSGKFWEMESVINVPSVPDEEQLEMPIEP